MSEGGGSITFLYNLSYAQVLRGFFLAVGAGTPACTRDWLWGRAAALGWPSAAARHFVQGVFGFIYHNARWFQIGSMRAPAARRMLYFPLERCHSNVFGSR